MAVLHAFCLAVAASTVCAAPKPRDSKYITIPLRQRQVDNADAFVQTLHAASRHVDKTAGFTIAPETLDAGFWYGTFDVGNTKNLSLLIDTGSNDVAVNPHLYEPSPESKNLHEKGELQFATAQANGCGFADIHYTTYSDVVTMAGLTSHNQTLANVVKSPPPNPQTITVFPHQGLVGFGGTKADQTKLGGVPFFQQLCDQGVVEQCRFGLAYGTEGKGKHILGGIDHALFDGPLHFSLVDTSSGATVAIDGSLVYHTKSGKKTLKNQQFLFDSGTSNVVGSGAQVQALFEDLGIQAVNQTTKECRNVLYGYYKCDSPARVGLTIGGEEFYIEPSAFKLADNGNNNCTATITGLNENFPFWIFGQSWFQGKYVDFKQPKTVGAATLKDKTLSL